MAATTSADLEKGLLAHQDVSSQGSGAHTAFTQHSSTVKPDHADSIPVTDYLDIYQKLVGIRTGDRITDLTNGQPKPPNKTKSNIERSANNGRPPRSFLSLFYKGYTYNDGYYQRAVDEQLKASILYNCCDIFFTAVYILQISVAAIITALSAYTGHRITLTILGAVNTVLAGLMAYFKGMGLPFRLRKSRDQFDAVRIYAEYKERQFSEYVHFGTVRSDPSITSLDPWIEADTVRKLYEAAKKDEQDNYPDLYSNNNTRDQLQKMMGTYETGQGARNPGQESHLNDGTRVRPMASVSIGHTMRTISHIEPPESQSRTSGTDAH